MNCTNYLQMTLSFIFLYWHTQYLHTVGEEKTAKINRDKELGVALEDSFVRKRITLDRD